MRDTLPHTVVGRDVFSEEFDHNVLFHAPRYLLFTHHSSNSQTELTRAGGRVEVVASHSQGHTAAAQCGLFTHKSVPVIFETPCICITASLPTQNAVNLSLPFHRNACGINAVHS